MKKLVIALALAVILLSCDNGGMETQNPYPDGVYPFEVANVSHNFVYPVISITWDDPSDSGFKNVQFELYCITGSFNEEEVLLYSSVTGETYIAPYLEFSDFTFSKNSFSCERRLANDVIAKIKCVDKYGNVSKGVEYR
jgi:hypothetical protein